MTGGETFAESVERRQAWCVSAKREWANEHARVTERMNEHAVCFVRNMRTLHHRAAEANAALRKMQDTFNRDWAPYRARWARKRVPRYLLREECENEPVCG